MTPSEKVGITLIIKKMVENRLRWFEYVERRNVDVVVRRVYQMEESQIKKGRERPKKTIKETIMKVLEVNEFDPNMVYDRTLWHNFMDVANLT
jgi:hypothetical protein